VRLGQKQKITSREQLLDLQPLAAVAGRPGHKQALRIPEDSMKVASKGHVNTKTTLQWPSLPRIRGLRSQHLAQRPLQGRPWSFAD
jgi:hypothetical protein